MRTIYDGYTLYETEMPAFFAGANTGSGFAGEYERIAKEEEKKRLWILKGGCGTGKSTLLRKITGDAGENGLSCRIFLCSADPDSLDAVEIEGGYMLLDGTAPHVWEMKYPGAVSEILYMGKYWKTNALAEKRDEITRLIREKTEAYRAGYAVLAALSRLEKEENHSAGGILDREKLEGYLNRLLRSVPKAERTGGIQRCRTWAITTKGLYRTNGLACQAEQHWLLEDHYQTAVLFLEMLKNRCEELQIPAIVSIHPIHDRIVEVLLPALSLHISLKNDTPDKTICMSRFVQKELSSEKRGVMRLRSRCMISLLEDACLHFRRAGEIHGALEAIYKDCMDFSRLTRETNVFRKQVQQYITEQH